MMKKLLFMLFIIPFFSCKKEEIDPSMEEYCWECIISIEPHILEYCDLTEESMEGIINWMKEENKLTLNCHKKD